MKKTILTVATVLTLSSSLLFSSCIGQFALFNKVKAWNEQIGDKFVNELVFLGLWIIPVYGISLMADAIVINSIEFWSGTNPIASSKKYIDGENGRYLVECDGKGYTITSESDKSVVRFDFDTDSQTWSIALPNGEKQTLLTFIDERHVKMPTNIPGEFTVVELSQSGVYAYQNLVSDRLFALAQ